MTRFQVGDIVVLNGHRLTVVADTERETWVGLYRDGRCVATVEGGLLPDAEPRDEPPPLTPGMAVAHRDGRLGLVTQANPRDGGNVWVFDVGDDHPRFVHPDDLRPVVLVEKPGFGLACLTIRDWAYGGQVPARLYEALFGPWESS